MSVSKAQVSPGFTGPKPPKTGVAAPIFQDFCSETTAPGFLRIGDPKRKWSARFAWILILIALTIIFAWQFAWLVEKYYDFEVNVVTSVSTVATLPFPTISLCNLNPFQRSALPKGSDLDEYVRLMEEAVAKNFSADILDNCNSSSNVAKLFCRNMKVMNATMTGEARNTALESSTQRPMPSMKPMMSMLRLEKKAFREIGMLGQNEHFNNYNMSWQTQDDLIRDCEYNMEACENENSSQKWVAWYNPWYGICYSINLEGGYQTIRPGPLYGFTVQLHVNKSEYLPTTFAVGVKVGITRPMKMPFPEIDGVFAPVGTATAIALSLAENIGKGRPYSECMKEDERVAASTPENYYYGGFNYTLNGCINTCLQRQIVKECGCWSFSYPPPPKSGPQSTENAPNSTAAPPPPGPANQTVTAGQIADPSGQTGPPGQNAPPGTKPPPPTGNPDEKVRVCDTSPETLRCVGRVEMAPMAELNCTCLPLCEELEYRLTVSHSIWPSTKTAQPCPTNAQNCSDGHTYAVENELKLQIYYDSMTKYTYTEVEAYGLLCLISDFGGQLGLWIGASLCTIVEILSLFVSLLVACCCGHRHDIEKHHTDDERAKRGYPLDGINGTDRPMETWPTDDALRPPQSTIYWS